MDDNEVLLHLPIIGMTVTSTQALHNPIADLQNRTGELGGRPGGGDHVLLVAAIVLLSS